MASYRFRFRSQTAHHQVAMARRSPWRRECARASARRRVCSFQRQHARSLTALLTKKQEEAILDTLVFDALNARIQSICIIDAFCRWKSHFHVAQNLSKVRSYLLTSFDVASRIFSTTLNACLFARLNINKLSYISIIRTFTVEKALCHA